MNKEDLPSSTPMELIQANRDHFDRVAHTGGYDDSPFVEQVSRQLANAIKEEFEFDEDGTVMLDYACGTGQMSRLLAPYTHEIIGVDISQGMVDYYNQRVHNQGIPPEEMRAVCVELTGAETDLDGKKFDLIVCSQAYHHFADISAATKNLAALLKPGGRLFVADLIKYDPAIFKRPPQTHSDAKPHRPGPNQQHSQDEEHHLHSHSHHHPHGHSHHHHQQPHHASEHATHAPFQGPAVAHRGGYTEEDMKPVFEGAGLMDWKFIPDAASAGISNVKRVDLFLAIGRRPGRPPSPNV